MKFSDLTSHDQGLSKDRPTLKWTVPDIELELFYSFRFLKFAWYFDFVWIVAAWIGRPSHFRNLKNQVLSFMFFQEWATLSEMDWYWFELQKNILINLEKELKFRANVHLQTLALKWLTMSISVQLSANEHSVFLIAPISIQIQFIFYSEFESLRPILRENVSGNAEIIFTLG